MTTKKFGQVSAFLVATTVVIGFISGMMQM